MFCNPPYGRALGAWVRKAYEEAQAGTTVVLLIPARTDTAYFHDYIYGKAEIRFLRGRLHFEDEDGNRFPPAPFPSMVVIYTAPYMEVDLYPVTPKQHKAGRRAKRKEASTLAQQTYNDNRAKRYHVQLVNANFGKGDFSWTGTYDDDHHPEPGDTAKADRDLTNYIKRLYRWCDKNGVQRPKWVAATEYCTVQEDGTACGRHHHHAIIQHTDGLTRDVLEQLWADKAGQIGFTRCEYLDVDHGSVESLVRYISKNKRCARSWRQSRGLEKPKTPPPNDTKWSRKKLDEASTLYIDDVAYWEQKYPGYTLNRVETRVSNAGWRHTTVIMRRAECWHGTPGHKVTPRMNR